MVLLFLTLLWAPVYFPWFKDSSSQLRAYQVPQAADFVRGDKQTNYSSSMTTGHLGYRSAGYPSRDSNPALRSSMPPYFL